MKKVLIILICIFLSGCSAANKELPPGDDCKRSGLSLDALSEKEKNQLYNKVSAEKVTDETDIFARDITLTALARARRISSNSPVEEGYVENKIDLKKMSSESLDHKYRILSKRIYDQNRAGPVDPDYINEEGIQFWTYEYKDDREFSDDDKEKKEVPVIEIIRFTALYSIGNELERRGGKTEFWRGFGSAASKTTGIALQLALTLAKYML